MYNRQQEKLSGVWCLARYSQPITFQSLRIWPKQAHELLILKDVHSAVASA